MENAFEMDRPRWIDCDNQLRDLRHKMESIRRQKLEYEITVLGHVRRMNLGRARVTLPDGHLTFGVHTSKTPLSLRMFRQALEGAEIGADTVERIFQVLDDTRGGRKMPVVRRVLTSNNDQCTVDNENDL